MGKSKRYKSVFDMVDDLSDNEFTIRFARTLIERKDRELRESHNRIKELERELEGDKK